MNVLLRAGILTMLLSLSACADLDSEKNLKFSSEIHELVPLDTPIANAVAALYGQGFHCDQQNLMSRDEVTCSKETIVFLASKVEWVDLIADRSRSVVVEARTRPIECNGSLCKYEDI